jgi:tRNA(Arg) A34 adenosine deaminase TadA
MCLGAIYWAGISKIYYSNNRKDAAAIGFSDNFIYEEILRDMKDRQKPIVELLPEEGKRAFEMWREDKEKVKY